MKTKLFLIVSTLIFSLLAQAQSPVHGIMMVVKGDITVTTKEGASEKAKVGKKVFSGDTVTAGKDSRAKIVMSDKNVLNVNPETKFTIEKYENDGTNKQVSLSVQFGKIRASVEQKYDGEKNQFNVKTPTAVAGVRGTDFLTSFSPATKSTSVTTFGGVVAVGTPGPQGQILNPVFVKPGQMTFNKAGEAPAPPSAVPKNQLQNMNNESSADNKPGPQGQQQNASEPKAEPKTDREPSSVMSAPGPGDLVKPEDMAPPVNSLPLDVGGGGPKPLPPPTMPSPTLTTSSGCATCNVVIPKGNTKVNVILNPQK